MAAPPSAALSSTNPPSTASWHACVTSASRSSRSPKSPPISASAPSHRRHPPTRSRSTAMTVTARPTTSRTVHDPTLRHSLAGGLFYILTFAASIPAWVLIRSSLNDDLSFIPGHETQLLWAGMGDWITAMTGVGAAVALYPVVKRQSQAFAIGYVTTRLVEAAVIMVGV